MSTTLPKILAIDPGTKELGFAILAGSRLSYYGVKTFKRRQPARDFLADVTRFVSLLISEHKPSMLAIERTYLIQKTSALLNVSAAEIQHTAISHGLVVYEYAPTEVRNIICQHSKALKREAVQVIVQRFPELAQFLRQPTHWESLYWAHMFDAVAVGLVCLDEIYGKPEPV